MDKLDSDPKGHWGIIRSASATAMEVVVKVEVEVCGQHWNSVSSDRFWSWVNIPSLATLLDTSMHYLGTIGSLVAATGQSETETRRRNRASGKLGK